ncbi:MULTISPECIES: NADH-quinone oxidoreductase subunit NuoH [Desulfosporosinus]|uniref:NADH-quinone oxidoreductase subunit H n=1 Tax=Desulfosporosinus nitroreducens TaxID=2018668 RepID=A0ABT8QLT6_9FIRM|nr:MULTISPECIES: NADH-quinone oxidoreductase subunit NuoH [Desulfosporosinus]MDA8223709.1 NADH-quinone oxidoreductase subunit NuoH [Desulfitobacterium hafniense]MCB8813936.1 NADH-quinone oxidoreductase subunit NuoH [Desulfosporosinus sp. SRJS8]MCO1601106.1 NADH-quinone oxidoreductase subunit NuoH [Desulfosporosinus nitroreducens]MCO5385438.1 NADH-quinone oxidoreductase subunit NuoH [Desulfosporosinus sp.]MDO0821610.1 NADH-quinone oxidoreductase subunit NuoH [Desulfosporosinus nitroreducens]
METLNYLLETLNNLFLIIADAIRGLFADPQSVWANLTMNVINFIIVVIIVVLAALILILLERKVAGWTSQRPGPNRLGPRGWFQTIADALKLMGKEDVTPAGADKLIFKIAPMIIFCLPMMTLAVIPYGKDMAPINIDLGILYFVAISSISTLCFLMAGWGSNNKYSLLGGMRAVAQMISYEIPLLFSLLGVVMITQSFNLGVIVEAQGTIPFIVLQPLAFVIFMIAGLAELNRAPFDLVEADQEVVAGPFTEYTGLRWGLFFLGEYGNMTAMSALAATVFLGGWQGPAFLPGYVWFFMKVGVMIFMMMWVRWTFPRIRIDHLMHLAWKVLLPLSIVNILLTGLGIYIYRFVMGG